MGYFTAVLAGVIAAVPQFLSFIPAPYTPAATAVLAALGALYHLYSPVPSDSDK